MVRKDSVTDGLRGEVQNGCDVSLMSSPAVRFAQILIIRRTVRILLGPLFSADENPTQTGLLPHVAEQGEQAQEKDEAIEDGDFEFGPLRDKFRLVRWVFQLIASSAKSSLERYG